MDKQLVKLRVIESIYKLEDQILSTRRAMLSNGIDCIDRIDHWLEAITIQKSYIQDISKAIEQDDIDKIREFGKRIADIGMFIKEDSISLAEELRRGNSEIPPHKIH